MALAATTGSNERAAKRAVPHLLALLHLPPGAVAAATDPSAGRLLAAAPTRPATPNLVEAHRFWVVSGDPNTVLTWVDKHPPTGSQANQSGAEGTSHGVTMSWTGFWLGPATAALSYRELVVTVARARSGRTAVRGDAQVVWVTVRPGWERVPQSARFVAITARGRSSRSLSVAGATARQVVGLVNALPAAQPGAFACPADAGPLVSMRFRRARSRPPLAIVNADGSGCGDVSFRLGNRRGPRLAGGPGLIKQLQLLLHTSLGLS